jgi:hypothetical protein
MDPTIATVLNQQFAEQVNEFRATSNNARNGDQHVAELLRNTAVNAHALVGAKAAQNLETSLIAREILQTRATKNQPDAKPE